MHRGFSLFPTVVSQKFKVWSSAVAEVIKVGPGVPRPSEFTFEKKYGGSRNGSPLQGLPSVLFSYLFFFTLYFFIFIFLWFFSILFILFYFIIHMCIQGLGLLILQILEKWCHFPSLPL
jgi:hypothetical protein